MPLPPINSYRPAYSRRRQGNTLPSPQQRDALALATTRMGSAKAQNTVIQRKALALENKVNKLTSERAAALDAAASLRLDLDEVTAERDRALDEAARLRFELDAALRYFYLSSSSSSGSSPYFPCPALPFPCASVRFRAHATVQYGDARLRHRFQSFSRVSFLCKSFNALSVLLFIGNETGCAGSYEEQKPKQQEPEARKGKLLPRDRNRGPRAMPSRWLSCRRCKRPLLLRPLPSNRNCWPRSRSTPQRRWR